MHQRPLLSSSDSRHGATVVERLRGSEWIHEVWKGDALISVLVVHSLVRGTARGGIRLAPDISEDEVRVLAEGMTLKFGLLGLPQGGAKAGILADPDGPEDERFGVLMAFVRALAPLLRRRTFIPGPDMGVSSEMVRRALLLNRIPLHARELHGRRSGYFTALTVFYGARHAAKALGLPLAGARVAIEDFGSVGSALARLFASVSARIVAVSTSHGAIINEEGLDVSDLVAAYAVHGSRFVRHGAQGVCAPRNAIFNIPVDILCPCARHNSIQADDANGLRARIVVSGANQPYDTQAEAAMVRRGLLCLPYWLTNCGGTLGETMEFAGWRDDDIRDFMDRRMGDHIQWLIQELRAGTQTPTEILKARSLARHQAVGFGGTFRMKALGLSAYQRGWIPASVMRRLSRTHFERTVFLPFDSAPAPRLLTGPPA